MVDINPINPQSVTVNVPSNGSLTVNNQGGSTAQVSTNADAQLAYSWACGVGLIQGIDYSAKYWAGKAKESELIAVNAIQGVEDAKDDAIAELESAKDTCLNDIELAGDDKVAEIEGLASDYESTLIALTYRAETAATNAEASKTAAAKRAFDAAASATSAENSSIRARNFATDAGNYVADAEYAKDVAVQAKENAQTAKTAAENAQARAEMSASNARDYEQSAYNNANAASNSATRAAQEASMAATARDVAEIARDAAEGYAQQAEAAKDDIEAELDNYVPNTRKVNNKPLSTDITLTASDIGALANTTKYGYSVALSLNTTDYKLTLTLKDQDGTTLSTKTVDFPIESVVVNGSYDSTNKKIVLTLQSGSTIDIPVGDLISGLQSEITSTNKLDSDLVDDTSSSHKFATAAQLNQIATNTSSISNLATVATSGSYNDLSNKPTIPDAQVQVDWDVTDTTSKAYIKNKPYIPSGVVVDQTYDGTSTNAQSGVAIAGAGFLQNTATGRNSLTLLGTATSSNLAINIGYNSSAGGENIAIGTLANTNGTGAIAIGTETKASAINTLAIGNTAKATANNAIQIGYGTNNTANKFNVRSFELLDIATGLIPDARISSNIARTSAIPDVSNFVTDTSLATTLSSYATQQWVTEQASALATSLQTWVTSQGYTSNVGTVTSVNNTQPDANGNVTISTGGTVDQTYDGTSANAQSGVAIAKAKFVQNLTTGTNSINIGGSASSYSFCTSIGAYSQVGNVHCTALGCNTNASGTFSTCIGSNASASASGAIQIGKGTNSTAETLQVGFGDANKNYQLLDGTTGLVPYQRLNGVTDNNSGSLKFWSGTQAEYDAIATKDSDTIYNVEDATSPIISILDSLYPVGAIYIGTMSACPLQTLGIGTWQLVAQDRVLQGAGSRGAVGTTINESLPNITGSAGVFYWGAQLASGAFSKSASTGNVRRGDTTTTSGAAGWELDASRSSSTYQNDAPVQQDGYLVNIWERIA